MCFNVYDLFNFVHFQAPADPKLSRASLKAMSWDSGIRSFHLISAIHKTNVNSNNHPAGKQGPEFRQSETIETKRVFRMFSTGKNGKLGGSGREALYVSW